jgi:glutathione synthase/RimK-type ligase-like ATP-grasp enzyme
MAILFTFLKELLELAIAVVHYQNSIMPNHSIALMIYGEPGSTKNIFTEEKYKKLAENFIKKGFDVHSTCYHDSVADSLSKELTKFDAILVWINPIEQQGDRKRLDTLLKDLSDRGHFVSAHPETILKIGTKEILYKVKDEQFGTNTKLYPSLNDFKEKFLNPIDGNGISILKQYRGNGGKGVFKVDVSMINQDKIIVTHATQGDVEITMNLDDFYRLIESYFAPESMLIEQEWNPNIINGMVRCYLTGKKVTGFGYQEVNALYPKMNSAFKKPGKRFYFSEDCGIFQDLKHVMETSWVSRLQQITEIEDDRLPIIWDADFFINKINSENAGNKYSLCEINASSVSPFPESSIPYIIDEVKSRIRS